MITVQQTDTNIQHISLKKTADKETYWDCECFVVVIKNHGAAAVHLYEEVVEVQLASHRERPLGGRGGKHQTKATLIQLNTNHAFMIRSSNSLDCYLPTHYFVSVLPVWHDVIESIDEFPQISHLVGFFSVESEGLGVLPNEGTGKKLAQLKFFWLLPSVCTCKTRTEDDLVMAKGLIGWRN